MLEIIRILKPGGKYHAPTRLVRCTRCGSEFARTGWPADIAKADGCMSCSNAVKREWLKSRGWDRDVDEAALESFSP